VFPRSDLACTPCDHARIANRARTDGRHTLEQIDSQMGYLRSVRSTGQHAQLIGREVTLLDPDEHAAALAAMQTHGDPRRLRLRLPEATGARAQRTPAV